jgi:hypothetical protein
MATNPTNIINVNGTNYELVPSQVWPTSTSSAVYLLGAPAAGSTQTVYETGISSTNIFLADGSRQMDGNITFGAIGDTASSAGLVWNGSTDGARIYYKTTAADQGNLILNMIDDASTNIEMLWSGSSCTAKTPYVFGYDSAVFTVSSLQVTGGLASKLVFGSTSIGSYNGAGTTDVVLPVQSEVTADGTYTVVNSIPASAGSSESTQLPTVNAVRSFAGDAKDIANMLHLGAYDTYTYDSTTGIYTVTRKTGYVFLSDVNWIYEDSLKRFRGNAYKPLRINSDGTSDGISSNASIPYNNAAILHRSENGVFIFNDYNGIYLNYLAFTTVAELVSYLRLNPTHIQYRTATSYTETYDDRHFALTGQPYIEEWKKSEADRSANLTPYNLTTFPLNSSMRHLIAENLPSGKYTLSLNLNTYNAGSEYIVYINDNSIGTYSNGTSATFTSNNYINSIKIYTNDSKATSAKIMLNEGSTPLPYQPYEGKVVHGKGLAETYLSKADASSTYVAKSSIDSVDSVPADGTYTVDTSTVSSSQTAIPTSYAVQQYAGSASTMTIGSDTSGTQYLTSVFGSGTGKAINKTSD